MVDEELTIWKLSHHVSVSKGPLRRRMRFEPDDITVVQKNISSRFSSNSEVFASELLENIEEIFPWYW